jgi:hypothetical protein
MCSDEYRELEKMACRALRDLLVVTEPGTGLVLHEAYAMLKKKVQAGEQTPTVEGGEGGDSNGETARWQLWQQTPEAERGHWVLNALGDETLSTSQIAARIAADHDGRVHDRNIKPTLARMLDQGELTRTQKLRTPGGTAWLWSYRRAGVSPEVLELERALSGDDGAVA